MGNLAAMLKSIGHEVTGSDTRLYPPMSDRLIEWGVDARPFHKKNLKDVELCIIGNVISRGNVEAELVLNNRIPFMSMPEALFNFFLKDKDVIVVAGTHGKTTTTFLMDHILTTSQGPPGLFAGGLRADGMNGFRVSDSKYFVIEGDEYDSAFFDKSAKFLHYRPRYLILTSVEFDHADIYENIKDYQLSFKRLMRIIPSKGLIAACSSDKGVIEILKKYKDAPIAYYSSKNQKPHKASKSNPKTPTRTFYRKGHDVSFSGYPGQVNDFALIGNHNTANASAASIIAQKLKLDVSRVTEALQTFPGVLRRQQIRKHIPATANKTGKIIFMEDFAHHPTAVAGTIEAVKNAWPGYKIHALYEPRSATSHTNIFQKEYIEAFNKAHFIYLPDVYDKKKVESKKRLNIKALVASINKKNKYKKAWYAKDPQKLLTLFKKKFKASQSGDIILAMSNGNFGGIYPEIDKWLAKSAGQSE